MKPYHIAPLLLCFACTPADAPNAAPVVSTWDIDDNFTGGERSAVVAALDWWCDVDPKFCWQYRYRPVYKRMVGTIAMAADAPTTDVLGTDGPVCDIMIWPENRTHQQIRDTVAHEIGHCLGLGHTEADVMAPTSRRQRMCLDPATAAELCRRNSCDPSLLGHLCEAG